MTLSDLIDIPRFYTAVAEWSACFVYLLIFKQKIYSNKKFCFYTVLMFLWFCFYQWSAGQFPLYLWVPGIIGAIISILFFLVFPLKLSFVDGFFCCIRAFVLAEFVASLHWQLYVWFTLHSGKESSLLCFLSVVLLYGISYTIYYFLEKEHLPNEEALNVNRKELFGTTLVGLSAFIMGNLSFVAPNTPFSSATFSLLYIRTLVDFSGLVMLFSQQDKRKELCMRSENQAMNIVLQRQYENYRMSIDNIELLRREFHDLKHYMLAISSEQNPEKREQYLSEMEQAILTQEAFTHTGNQVLDVVLTTKYLYCIKNNIHFTCMADGKLLSFMHVKDICSIFGNALDNAIEYVSQLEDPEKRFVSLSLFQKNDFLMIEFENYMETSLSLQRDTLPSTTKKNKEYHGYGLKSIQIAVKKYNGSMTLHGEHHTFTLRILFPLSPSK